MTTLLTVSGLKKSFGGVEAVKDVSFDLRPGQLLALIGPNGAGKSTTFNCLNGQLKPDAGTVMFNPLALGTKDRIQAEKEDTETDHSNLMEITGLAPHKIWRLGIGRTFQITATFLSMSVVENVQLTLVSQARGLHGLISRVSNLYKDKAMELLTLVGLESHADTACSVLAYGDLKRLELAIALANDPKLLLMDEPTAGMGVSERLSLMTLTHEIAKKNDIGVLFTEHDMDMVFGFADWIVVMHRGAILTKGQGEAIKTDKKVKEVYLGTQEVS